MQASNLSINADSSDDTSAVIREFSLCDGDSSSSSEFDWGVFEDFFPLAGDSVVEVSALGLPAARQLPLYRSPRTRVPGRRVQRSKVVTRRGRRSLGGESSSGIRLQVMTPPWASAMRSGRRCFPDSWSPVL